MGMLDRLYRSSEKDLASGDAFIRRFVYQFQTAAVAAAQVSITDSGNPVPNDVVREITSVGFSWAPGAAQFGIYANVNIVDVTNVAIGGVILASPEAAGVAGQATNKTVGGLRHFMFQGDFLLGTVVFNAGAAANQGFFYVAGLEYPRGTFRR